MTLGSGETSLGEHHRATTKPVQPPTHPPSCMIWQPCHWWSPYSQFWTYTGIYVCKRKWLLLLVNVCRALMCILGRRPRPVPWHTGGCMTTRDQSTLANYQFECNTPWYWSPNPSHRYHLKPTQPNLYTSFWVYFNFCLLNIYKPHLCHWLQRILIFSNF